MNNPAKAFHFTILFISRSDKVQRPAAGIRGAGTRVRKGKPEEHQRRGCREEDRGPSRYAEPDISRDSDLSLPGIQQPLH